MAFRELPVEFRTIEDDIVPYMLFREVLARNCGANSFDCLTELQRYTRELAANPAGVDAVGLPRGAGTLRDSYGIRKLAMAACTHLGPPEFERAQCQ